MADNAVQMIAFDESKWVVVDGNGKTQILTMREKEVSWGQLVELMPDAISKVKGFVSKGKKDEKEEGGVDVEDVEDGDDVDPPGST